MHWLPSAALVCHSFAVRAIFCASCTNNACAFVRISRYCLQGVDPQGRSYTTQEMRDACENEEYIAMGTMYLLAVRVALLS